MSAVYNIDGDIMDNSYKWATEYTGVIVPSDVRDFFETNKGKDITLNINSNGGDVFAGIEISNIIKEHNGKVVANIQGVAASAASFIALSCDEIKMHKSSFLMVHKPFCYSFGNANDLSKTIELLNKIQNTIVNIYMDKVNDESITVETINKMVDDETWLNGEEARQFFNIQINDDIKVFNKVSSMITHKKQPKFEDYSNEEETTLLNEIKTIKYI